MDNYLGHPPAQRPWRTGDLGVIDKNGVLIVHGRKDSLIVTSFGRNISPEWIETLLLGDPLIAICAVTGHSEPCLTALLIPSAIGVAWFANATDTAILDLISECCSTAPAYAVPQKVRVVSLAAAIESELVSSNGRPRRARISEFINALAEPHTLLHNRLIAKKGFQS